METRGFSAAGPENRFAASLFAGLPSRYDTLAELLSFRQNARWRAELVRHIAKYRPETVLDVATGTAGVAIAIARATDAQVIGVDISEDMLERGRERVRAAGFDSRVHLELARAEELPFPVESFDAVSFTYLLRYVADPGATVRELARVLKPGGGMASLDFNVPPSLGWRLAWRAYTRIGLPLAGAVLGGRAWWDVGRFLGPSIDGFHSRWPLYRVFDAWREAGMVDLESHVMSLGGGLVMWGRKHHG